jgi:hypothetical protein
MISPQRKLLIHILCCLAFLSLPFFSIREGESFQDIISSGRTKKDFIAYVFMIGAFYANYFFFIPRLYFKKKILYFIFAQLACFALIALVLSFIHFRPPHAPLPDQALPRFPGPPRPTIFSELRHHLFLYLAVVFVSLTLKISLRWQIAEREKVNAELSYLKAQINPHFLFNTLNSIYSLAIMKSDNTADTIVKLSEIMRYILTDATHSFVNLNKELHQIDNYIALQRVRLGNTVTINYTAPTEASDQKIAPLILIHFIENAFKYGVNPDENSLISVNIKTDENKLIFKVSNNKVSSIANEELSSGTGIANSRSRLQLLYPGKHLLTIADNKESYSVELILILS